MTERRRDMLDTAARETTPTSRASHHGDHHPSSLDNQSALRRFGLQRKADPNAAAVQGPLLVDDEQPELAPGQMSRSHFLATLRTMVTATADQILGPLWTTAGCPYLDRWFAEHAHTDAATLERMALRYAGAGATSAQQLIYGVCARLRPSIVAWRDGGDINTEIVEAGLSLSTPAPEGEPTAQAKRAPGGETPAHGPGSLGAGSPLDSGVAGRLGGVLGANLADVRVHSDTAAARSAASQGALAYTVGNHVVFGQGRYQPGTPMGDALIAHELAHVVQQRGGGTAMQSLAYDDDQSSSEVEADQAAIAAIGALHGNQSLASLPLRLHSGGGLRLQRCKSKKTPDPPPPQISTMDAAQLKAITDKPADHTFSEVAAATARATMLSHQAALASTGQGLWMGNHGTPAAPAGVTRSDCTEWALSVLGSAFAAKGQTAEWDAIKAEALRNSGAAGLKGTELLKAIQARGGWTGIFFGPDPRNPADSQSEHPFAYKIVREQGTYYDIGVDQDKSVVEYRRTDTTKAAQTANLERLRKIPFGIMVARGGRHVMLMINGIVYELHWDRLPTDPDVIHATPLETWPDWQSGVILVPTDEATKAWR